MKIIKRDGRVVDYDRNKIVIAIEKANNEVKGKSKVSKEDIKTIVKYIEDLDKKRMLVEDIQDIIEQQLMEIGKYELAKKYIVYRYNRALVRKSNTIDESILGLIRNTTMPASSQRDYIAGEVSKDLTKRLLLPEKIIKAIEEEILYFPNAEYFIQPIINSCIIKIGDMLENGTVINGKNITTPNSFEVACIIVTQIIISLSTNQYGELALNINHLGKYLRKSYDKTKEEIEKKYKNKIQENIIEEIVKEKTEKELKLGIEIIQYQINTLMTINNQSRITFILQSNPEDEYIEENTKIVEEIKKQKDKSKEQFPKLIYVIDEKYKYEGKFNQGIVNINLPKIVIDAGKDKEKFWELLDERLELCKEALMCRHYALLGTKSDISPLHWQYGAIARLEKEEKIDKLLYGEYSNLTLGYVGISEAVKLLETEEKEKIIKVLKEKTKQWKKETNIEFIISEEN